MSTFPTKPAAEAWLAHHGYRPRSWGSARSRVWERPGSMDHICTVTEDLAGNWHVDEHQKD